VHPTGPPSKILLKREYKENQQIYMAMRKAENTRAPVQSDAVWGMQTGALYPGEEQ